MPRHDPMAHGATGDGRADDTAAVQRALDQSSRAGGGTVVIPGGKSFLAGALSLGSNVNLHLEPGSRLVSATEREAFPGGVWIRASGAENVYITGHGTIDGRGKEFMVEELDYIYRGSDWRPEMIRFERCREVTVRDVTLVDSANWAVRLVASENIVIGGVTILNDLKVPNCDGIDPDCCRNVRISDCHIEAGDDCVCVKAKADPSRACENVTVTGCTLVSTSCAIKIGSETAGDIRDVVFDACVIRASNRGLGIQHRDGGVLENVVFSNCIVETRLFCDAWWGKAEPIYVTNLRRERGAPLGRVRNVRFSNILCRGESGVYVDAEEDVPVEGLVFENVRVEIGKTSKWPGGVYDRRPCPDQASAGLVESRIAGFFARNASGLALRDCEVAWGGELPDYYGHALECRNVRGLEIVNFRGEAAHPGRDAAQLIEEPPAAGGTR